MLICAFCDWQLSKCQLTIDSSCTAGMHYALIHADIFNESTSLYSVIQQEFIPQSQLNLHTICNSTTHPSIFTKTISCIQKFFQIQNLARNSPTPHFERRLCSDIQKPAFIKVRAFQETGFSLPSALSLFISLSLSPSLSLFRRTPVFKQTFNHIVSIAALPFSAPQPPTVHVFPSSSVFLLTQMSHNGRQN